MCRNESLKEGFTHGGVFHADDVFATALLKIINPDIRVWRGFTVPENFVGIVYDVGRGKYDHHQQDSRVRDNGVPYAAFGLLWEQFGEMILDSEDARKFDEDFIQLLDRSDNTGEKNMLALIIADKVPTWQEEQGQRMDSAFWEAVEFAETILKGRFKQIRANRAAYEMVCRRIGQCKDRILYLEQAVPWKDAVENGNNDILYVIFPSIRGGYNIQAVPDKNEKSRLRLPFPESWRGAEPEELHRLTGIEDLSFCHLSGFLCAAATLEGAYSTAQLAMRAGCKDIHHDI